MRPMRIHDLLIQSLNEPQRRAVTAKPCNLLVLAGAGSGKTRVLAGRIAWLIQHEDVSPYHILAVTFTNKAAHEMRGRIESLLQSSLSNMWVGTFHRLAHRLLHIHYQAADLPKNFQILDSADQYRLVRRIQRNLKLDDTKWPTKQFQWFINKEKEQQRRSGDLQDHRSNGEYFIEIMRRVYRDYESICYHSGLVDFVELLLRSLELLKNNADIREHYQKRFQYILVDEFQDTNALQYDWLKSLKAHDHHIMAVGDDDQSIYSWRGACIENIHKFSQDFAKTTVIRLEQNYRSTQTILSAANGLIDHNDDRLGKVLWTNGVQGELIKLYVAFNEWDEACYITNIIQQALQQGVHLNDIVILYRSNAQSRVLEESLTDAHISYRIYGGLKFFERSEIKDALGYLRLITNPHDDAAFERIVNFPVRGIGQATLMVLRTVAHDRKISLWLATEHVVQFTDIGKRAVNALKNFMQLIRELSHKTHDKTLGEQTRYVLEHSGLLEHYEKDSSDLGLSRLENLTELMNATTQFQGRDIALSPLASFLSHVFLERDEGQMEPNHNGGVNLMTLHAAKGLEFPWVFLCGLEEGLFPHKISLKTPQGLEEERRLCYVGMTRAMERLFLTYAESRRLHGQERYNRPSRFLEEIPGQFLDSVRIKTKISRTIRCTYTKNKRKSTKGDLQQPVPANQSSTIGFTIGQSVRHKKFGKGVILSYEGEADHTRIRVKFDRYGIKWLVARYAKLILGTST